MPKIFSNFVWIFLFCAMVLFLGFEALTASQEIPSEQHRYRADNTKRGTEPNVTVEESHPSEQASKRKEKQAKAAEHAIEFLNIKISDALIAIFTIVLAYKTAGLFKETAGLREAAENQRIDSLRSIAATEAAAIAAQKSADTAERALVAANQPFILMETIAFGGPEKDGSATIDFVLGNDGNGTAIIMRVGGQIQLIETVNGVRQSSEDTWDSPVGTSIPAGKTAPLSISARRISKTRYQRVLSGEIELYVDITVSSNDIFNNRIESPFSFMFDATSGRFIRDSAVRPNPESGGKRRFHANPRPTKIT